MTDDRVALLTEREKETLRLLVRGHDAKSIARELGLSVHTINERLRDARRKLGVSSSREAARILVEAEQMSPDFLVDKDLGVPTGRADTASTGQPRRRYGAPVRLFWLSGGMLVMSMFVAVLVLSSSLTQGTRSAAEPSQPVSVAADAEAASIGEARTWLAYLDEQRWEESWRTAATLFRSQITAPQWASTIQSVRQSLGEPVARTLVAVTNSRSLPGLPAGDYEILQFQTDFANRKAVVETVTFVREPSGWRVIGYFVR